MIPKVGDKICFRGKFLEKMHEKGNYMYHLVFEVTRVDEKSFCFKRQGRDEAYTERLDNFNGMFVFYVNRHIRYINKRRTSLFKPK